MKNKKSSIEVLADFLLQHCNPIVCDIEWSDFKIAIQEAKAMHKEESITYAHDFARQMLQNKRFVTPEIIYNETFNNNE